MKLKLPLKTYLKHFSVFSILSCLFFLFLTVIFSVAPTPVYSQTWNLQRINTDLRFFYSSSGATPLYLTDGGSVGIGTTSPSSPLHLSTSNDQVNEFVKFETTAGGAPGSSYIGQARSGYANLLVLGNGTYADGTAAISITPSNNVGIGNIAPAFPLVVGSTSGFTVGSAGDINTTGSIDTRTTSADGYLAVARLTLKSTDNITDGTGPNLRFDISDDTVGTTNIGNIGFVRNGADNSGALQINTVNAGSTGTRFWISAPGDVGIGTTAPSAKLHVNGTARIETTLGVNGYGPAGCGVGFGLCVGGSSGGQSLWTNTSDGRLKKNITPVSNALKKVMALQGVYFDFIETDGVYKTLPKNRQLGYIAQEVEPILPEVVTTGPDGIKSLSYANINALLTEAIKEQQKQIETEKARNEKQQEEIEQLKLEIEQLKNR